MTHATIDPIPSNVFVAKAPVPVKKNKMNFFFMVVIAIAMGISYSQFPIYWSYNRVCATLFYF